MWKGSLITKSNENGYLIIRNGEKAFWVEMGSFFCEIFWEGPT